MRPIETERLVLRNWQDGDRSAMHRLNSDEQVMKYFPFRRNRIESSLFMEAMRKRNLANKYGWAAMELKASGRVIGFAGLNHFTDDVACAPAMEIGWRLLPEHWGNGYATEAARGWLNFGFTELGLDHIVSFAVPENTGSTAVMERLGMRPYPEFDFDHPAVGDEYAHLKRHVFYSISSDEFNTAARK